MSRRLRVLLLGAVATIVGALGGWYLYRSRAGDPVDRLAEPWNQGHRILARHGEVMRVLPSEIGQRGRPIELEAVGDRLVLATLVSEDKRFYEHGGVDAAAIVRALGQNARSVRIVSGASTITQQLVKLLDAGGRLGEGERTLAIKLREAARAENLEARLSKSEILASYLNRLSYGRGLVGPAAASESYFGVSPRELSWAQAALLAVLPRAPSYLDPYNHPERGRLRQLALLDALRDVGIVSVADHARAVTEPITLEPLSWPFEAPHLTEALRLGKLGGLSDGEQTQTTIDLALQRDLEGLLDTHRARLVEKRASAAALVVLDNASGEVLAYLGGGSWHEPIDGGQIDMARARRQPGSTLKPFVYAMAFEAGLQPSEMLADVPTRFGEASGAYSPENFDGVFIGPVSAREALAGSLNVPAVRLAATFEQGALLDRLHRLGLASLDRPADHYGLALALGSGEVSLLELAGAYATLARGGVVVTPRLTVTSSDGLGAAAAGGVRVFSATAVAAVSDALSDPLARVRGLGGSGPFDLGFAVAIKTGTSSGYRDSWTVGYTRERTVAVWVGRADAGASDKLTGASGAGPLFADAMRRTMEGVSVRRPLWDEGLLEEASVCPLSGKRATSACPETVSRRLIPSGEGAPHEACVLHRHARGAKTRADEPAWTCDPSGDQVIVTLPESFTAWLGRQPLGAPGRDAHGLPWLSLSQVRGCSEGGAVARLRIDDPPHGSVLLAHGRIGGEPAQVELAASLEGPRPDGRQPVVEFVLDGRVVARSSQPYRAHVAATPGDHLLEVRPADPQLSVRLSQSRFSVR